jgi:hypothetical protein
MARVVSSPNVSHQRVHSQSGVLRRGAREASKCCVDQRFEMHCFGIARGQSIGGIDGRVWGNAEKQQFACTRQQYLERGSRAMRRERLVQAFAQQCVELAETAQGFARDGARKTGIARREIRFHENFVLRRVERAAFA